MTKSHEVEDRRLRRKTAAFRLKHDVGKALRWSAPEEPETDPAALRARLAADLLPRATDAGAKRDVLKSFFEWKRDEGSMFDSSDADLQALEEAMATVARLAPDLLSLKEISLSSLQSLDSACLEASRACTAFYRRVAVEEGPEVLRPLGGRGRRGGGS
ncbi:MAG TPA: hypothetical protein PLB01_18680 [Thermoanaerobaculia bacterium]|nr:hypothetical protein [Thermoanaerobaculia bacterium]